MIKKLLLACVALYRNALSPWLGSACRFEPTCSRYAQQAIEQHDVLAGTYLTTRRLMRCHPWCSGGHDPVPVQRPTFHDLIHSRTERTAPKNSP